MQFLKSLGIAIEKSFSRCFIIWCLQFDRTECDDYESHFILKNWLNNNKHLKYFLGASKTSFWPESSSKLNLDSTEIGSSDAEFVFLSESIRIPQIFKSSLIDKYQIPLQLDPIATDTKTEWTYVYLKLFLRVFFGHIFTPWSPSGICEKLNLIKTTILLLFHGSFSPQIVIHKFATCFPLHDMNRICGVNDNSRLNCSSIVGSPGNH